MISRPGSETSDLLERGQALCHRGNLAEGMELFRQALAAIDLALRTNPGSAELHADKAEALAALGRPAEAQQSARRALVIDPNSPKALALFDASRSGDAGACIAQGRALAETAMPEPAIEQFRAAIRLDPNRVEAYGLLAEALGSLGRFDEAFAELDRARIIAPDELRVLNTRASLLGVMGRFEPMRSLLEEILAAEPGNFDALFTYATYTHMTKRDPKFASLLKIEPAIGSLPLSKQIRAHFVLGKALADAGDHAPSFAHIEAGNRLKRSTIRYDENLIARKFHDLQEIFSKELIRKFSGSGYDSPLAVFVLGMPRSGTSLIEQILASHPEVHGAGELHKFPFIADAIGCAANPSFPQFLRNMRPEELREIGRVYTGAAAALAPSASRVVDKMPENFFLAGLIHLALPNARIVHCMRDPFDTCMSCFANQFHEGQEFAYDLGELGRYFRRYEKLMQHWREVLPAGVMLDVQYENVIDDLEGQARRIVEHAGLPWNEACLSFHKTERPVRTASAGQVRQPIYRSAIGRWLPYKDRIQPLLEALGNNAA